MSSCMSLSPENNLILGAFLISRLGIMLSKTRWHPPLNPSSEFTRCLLSDSCWAWFTPCRRNKNSHNYSWNTVLGAQIGERKEVSKRAGNPTRQTERVEGYVGAELFHYYSLFWYFCVRRRQKKLPWTGDNTWYWINFGFWQVLQIT